MRPATCGGNRRETHPFWISTRLSVTTNVFSSDARARTALQAWNIAHEAKVRARAISEGTYRPAIERNFAARSMVIEFDSVSTLKPRLYA